MVVGNVPVGMFTQIQLKDVQIEFELKMRGAFNMKVVLEIMWILLPIVIVGAIGLFVVTRLKHKYSKGELGKKKTKSAQNWLDSLIPIGIIVGCNIGILFGIYSSFSVLTTGSLGAGLGMLCGYFGYEIYSNKETDHS